MLKIFYGDMEGVILNTSLYFKNTYQDEWITDELSKEMIKEVDKSDVVAPRLIESPILGPISPIELSGGVKTLILIYKEKSKIFNASKCGNNCAKWLLKLAENQDITINLRHLMNFGKEDFEVEVLNTHQVVCNMKELISVAGELV